MAGPLTFSLLSANMGIVFGSTKGLEMPSYAVIHAAENYQVRKYAPSILVSADYGPQGWTSGSSNSPFNALAKYIGVFGTAHNVKQQKAEKIAMTAPVLVQPTPEPIKMTAPVIVDGAAQGRTTMSFVLPHSKYKTIDEAPKPTDPNVTLTQLPERVQAVRTYSYSFSPESAKKNLDILLEELTADGWVVRKGPSGHPLWQAAGYNPPFSLPFLKRNEILVEVEEK